jgi:hypothetical protein
MGQVQKTGRWEIYEYSYEGSGRRRENLPGTESPDLPKPPIGHHCRSGPPRSLLPQQYMNLLSIHHATLNHKYTPPTSHLNKLSKRTITSPIMASHLRGSCTCGRNNYAVIIPSEATARQEFEIFFDDHTENAYLRVPISRYQSFTTAFYPDETHSSIRRTFTPQHARKSFGIFSNLSLSPTIIE